MYCNILVPVSFDEDRDIKGALDIARALSIENAKVTLLHIMEQVPAYAINYIPDDYLNESRNAIATELSKMASTLPNGEGVVRQGHSGRAILDYAAEIGADCIVIASHRPGMQDYLLGSTAHQVVRHARCSVHVLR
ncbi:universal stress protein [Primorskyibacter sedentarius]|uniref:Nucleotide-binding universal stress UspA family protein n=1 Tax=Primorskyibacter sedentarius TaxID=745311 RepID=A0A4R3JKJ5_9RHOB|nr:universal stress protein [Primorskyibacter sedentarius]TCS65883.1 nucleotide-binding universal stress UspA family protein [Primorskyibacter sedentarius]